MRINKTCFGGALVCALAMLIYMTAGMSLFASADDNNGSLTLICKSGDTVLADMDWNLYRVGARSDDEFVLQDDFADYPVSLADTSATAWQDAANTLENYAKLDSLTALSYGTTDEDGELYFDGLAEGLYLISGKSVVIDTTKYIPSAALIEITENEDGLYDWSVYPKFEQKDTSSSVSSQYSVEKIWQNDDTAARPKSITVDIYADGELSDTVTLDESNSWSYEWEDEDSEIEWSVKERDVAAGYTVVYRQDEAQFVIVNSFTTTTVTTTSSTSSTPGTTTSIEKLPQTGQLWWPVPILSIVGLVLVAVGWRLQMKKDDTEK